PRYDRGDLQLHPDNPITVAPQANEDWVIEIRRQNNEAMARAVGVIEEAYADFRRVFGRGPENPWFEEYMTDDAEVILVGMGTISLPIKVAIREMRAQGREIRSKDPLAGRAGIGEATMAETTTFSNATQILEPFRGVKRVTIEEYFTSGHRTCQGCESALVMKLMVKASGPRTIVLGSTGCMYVANTTYYTTPWVVPWMHTQLGSSGSAALGTAAGLKALMKKGKMKSEP